MICDEKLGTSDNTDWTQTLLDIGYESKNKEEKKKDFEAIRQENNYLVKSDNKYIHKKLHTNPSTICLKYLNSLKFTHCPWCKSVILYSNVALCTKCWILQSHQTGYHFTLTHKTPCKLICKDGAPRCIISCKSNFNWQVLQQSSRYCSGPKQDNMYISNSGKQYSICHYWNGSFLKCPLVNTYSFALKIWTKILKCEKRNKTTYWGALPLFICIYLIENYLFFMNFLLIFSCVIIQWMSPARVKCLRKQHKIIRAQQWGRAGS